LHVYGAKVVNADAIAVLTAVIDNGVMDELEAFCEEGTSDGMTKIVIRDTLPTGYTAYYSLNNIAPVYDQTVDSTWNLLGNGEFTVEDGKPVFVCYADSLSGKIKAGGYTTTVVA